MKKGSHKNQIIITTLALLLAVVGYISYDNRDTFMNAKDVLSTEIEAVNGKADTKESKECEDTQASDEVALETDSTEEILNAGETVLTSASTESEECVAQVKLGREQVRSKNKEALQKIIDDAGGVRGREEERGRCHGEADRKCTDGGGCPDDAGGKGL